MSEDKLPAGLMAVVQEGLAERYKDPFADSIECRDSLADGRVIEVDRSRDPFDEGQFKKVYLCATRSEVEWADKICVWKVARPRHKTRNNSIINGIKLAKACDHPNIAKIWLGWGAMGDETFTIEPDYGLPLVSIMPLHESMSWSDLRFVFLEVARGLAYLAGERIVHGDIALSNIWIGPDGVVIGDMDSAQRMKKRRKTVPYPKGVPGRRFFQSPEKMRQRRHGFSSDIWAFGVLMYYASSFLWERDSEKFAEYLHGMDTVPDRRLPERVRSVFAFLFRERQEAQSHTTPDFPSFLEQTLGTENLFPEPSPSEGNIQEVIAGCLMENPEDRLTAAELIDLLRE